MHSVELWLLVGAGVVAGVQALAFRGTTPVQGRGR